MFLTFFNVNQLSNYLSEELHNLDNISGGIIDKMIDSCHFDMLCVGHVGV